MNKKQLIVLGLAIAALALACFYRPWIIPGIQPTPEEVVNNPGVNFEMKSPDLVFLPANASVPQKWIFASAVFQLVIGMILAAGITAYLSFRQPSGTDWQYVAIVATGFCVFGSLVIPPIKWPGHHDYQIASAIGHEKYEKVFGGTTRRDRLFCELYEPELRIDYFQLATQCCLIMLIGSVAYNLAAPPLRQAVGGTAAQSSPGLHSP